MKTAKTEIQIKSDKDAAARLEMLRKETAKLEKQWGLARGTRDVTQQADTTTIPPLEKRIEAALRTKPHSIEELSRELKESSGRVTTALKSMRKHLFNAGTEHAPAWFWIVGDEAGAQEINTAVEALVTFKPMRFPELLAATGARQGRVSGAIVALQRNQKSRLVNLDTAMRARWFVVPEGVALARLKSR